MTRESGFEEHEDGMYGDGMYGDEMNGDEMNGDREREGEARTDERLHELLTEAAPEFPVTSALGDRAVAGATRRRARTRAFGGAGALAVTTVGVLVVAPLAGWGGHRSGASDARVAAGALAASSTASTPSPSATSSPSPYPAPRTLIQVPVPSNVPAWNAPKMKAVDRVMNALQSGHDNSYMGVSLSGQDFVTGSYKAGSGYDSSPIVVYRKPVADPTLEHDAIEAAAPFSVVFRDSVLDSSEQWFLGHRMEQDKGYWESQGVKFLTGLQSNGTITVFTADPATVLPLLEQHYGYDGRVFVGRQWNPQPASPGSVPSVPSSTGP